jgi:hypothetical protein
MEEAGFEVVAGKYINMLGAAGWFFNGRILRKHVPPRGQLRLLNRVVPVLRSMERAIPAPFGVSLLMVGEKPVAAPSSVAHCS